MCISELQLQLMAGQKLEVRERKRDALLPDSEWRKEKYNAAFVVQQMSDDKDTLDDNGAIRRQIYTSRAPIYRSAVVSNSHEHPILTY